MRKSNSTAGEVYSRAIQNQKMPRLKRKGRMGRGGSISRGASDGWVHSCFDYFYRVGEFSLRESGGEACVFLLACAVRASSAIPLGDLESIFFKSSFFPERLTAFVSFGGTVGT